MIAQALNSNGISVSRLPLLMYGVLFVPFGLGTHVFGVLLGLLRVLLGLNNELLALKYLDRVVLWNAHGGGAAG